MIHKRIIGATFLLIFNNFPVDTDYNSELWGLFEKYDQYVLRTYPEYATYEGDHRYDDLLSDESDEGVRAGYDTTRAFLKELEKIDYSSLTSENKLNYDLFKTMLEQDLEGEKFYSHYMPIAQQNGLHIDFPQLIETQPLSTYEEYQKYFKRLRGFEKKVNDVINNIRKGMGKELVMPVFLIELTLPQMEKIKDTPVEKSVFYSPFNKENKLTPDGREKIGIELKNTIETYINKSYQKLYDFVKFEYLPKCRQEAGIWSLPDGKERYQFIIKNYTTTSLTADEIHNIGMKEVERILAEMEKVKNEIGFQGSLDEFNTFIKTDKQFYYTDKVQLMDGFRVILREMDKKLPELFGILPEARYDFKEIEEYRAKSAPAAYYYSAPEDRSRPGYFYVNTYDLSARPKYTMTALALHEAVPGHHLQIAIAQELKNLPKFRRNMGVTAFIEGWGLYSESLGFETGMYTDKYQHYGALTFEMWRACRLVVDTGIHEKRWTRQQAYDFIHKYTPNSDQDLRSEIDRYIAWPGQALAYKIGEMKIKELRKKAENKLGNKFKVKEFHDNVLKNGAVPLP
ncbi:MAG: DUF885 domain-containing protein, partial [Ignavibacteria bacterium]